MPILEVRNLCREFKNGNSPFLAVDHVSFALEAGTVLSLIGPNGAGKTTIVRMISGYLSPTSGDILVNGVAQTPSSAKGPRSFGVVFGGELGFYGRAAAIDNLIFFANLAGLPRSSIRQEAERVLEAVSLSDVAHKPVRQFSRGMRQRLHIARALLGSPKILLLDEPTNGLDVEMAHELHSLILSLAHNGVAILLTSHTMSEIESLSDRVLLLGGGKIFHDGTVKSVVSLSQIHHVDRPATLEESYLALAPYLRRQSE